MPNFAEIHIQAQHFNEFVKKGVFFKEVLIIMSPSIGNIPIRFGTKPSQNHSGMVIPLCVLIPTSNDLNGKIVKQIYVLFANTWNNLFPLILNLFGTNISQGYVA